MTAHAERCLRQFVFDKSRELIRRIFENARNLEGKAGEESLHDMRVATRRLREAWRLFEPLFPPSRLRKQLAKVRELTRTLGMPREMDVNFTLLSRFEPLPDSNLCLRLSWEHLLEKLHHDRQTSRRRMKKRLKRIDLKARETGFSLLAEVGLNGPGRTRPRKNELGDFASPEEFLREQLVEKSTPLCGLSAAEVENLADKELHQLRIAAKKFRYSLEIANPLFAGSFDPLIQSTRELQDTLGLNHDYGMLIEYLQHQVEALGENGRTGLLEGTESVLVLLESEKARLHQGISAFHSRFRESLCASALLNSAATAPPPPEKPPEHVCGNDLPADRKSHDSALKIAPSC
jgi:CHAD domain-containing protein